MKTLLAILTILTLTACTDEKEANRVLSMNGYSDIHFTGYGWFSCSKDDWYHTKFEARINGNPVNGVVCSGLLFKASTIRF